MYPRNLNYKAAVPSCAYGPPKGLSILCTVADQTMQWQATEPQRWTSQTAAYHSGGQLFFHSSLLGTFSIHHFPPTILAFFSHLILSSISW